MTAKRKKRTARRLQVPTWYWIALAGAAVIGIALLAYSATRRVNEVGVTTEGDYFQGNPEAPITIIDWGNFGCGSCIGYARETLPLLRKRYIDTGKVKYIYRPLVLDTQERNSVLAAEALYCAGDQDKFWEMHDWMFANVDRWGQDADIIGVLSRLAGPELGLEVAAFRNCLETDKYGDHVRRLTAEANADGVTSTPTLLINEQFLVGPGSYSDVRRAIEEQQDTAPGLQLALAVGLPALWGLFILGGSGPRVGRRRLYLRMAIGGMALLGLLVAVYLSLYELSISGHMVCPFGGGCGQVNRSSYAHMFGVPTAVIGVLGYSLILVVALARPTRQLLGGVAIEVWLVVLSGIGCLFSLYLTYLEIFQIQALCTWCTLSTLLMTGMLGLSIFALASGQGEK